MIQNTGFFFSFISAVTMLGTPAEMFVFGTQYWMIGLAYPLVLAATAHIYLPGLMLYNFFVVTDNIVNNCRVLMQDLRHSIESVLM